MQEITVIKNEEHLVSIINEIDTFKSQKFLAETDFISVKEFKDDKFIIFDKTDDAVYECKKLYLLKFGKNLYELNFKIDK